MQPAFALRQAHEEVTEPGMQRCLQSMRAHQIQLTNWLIYTMNVDTPGYYETGVFNYRKKDGTVDVVPFVRWRTGPPVETGRALDFYLDANGMGFFTIELPGNNIGYTRDGRFQLDGNNRLVMMAGEFPVLGEGGYIYIPEDTDIAVAKSGTVFSNNDAVDRLRISIFTGEGISKLVPLNGSIFVANGPPETLDPEGKYSVIQFHIEQNNVLKSIVGDTAMAKYPYEASSKIARTLSKSMTQVVQMSNP